MSLRPLEALLGRACPLLVLVAALACAGTPTPETPAVAEAPLPAGTEPSSAQEQELLQAMAREAAPLPTLELLGPDEGFRTSVPARVAGPMRYRDGHTMIDLDLGATLPMSCAFFPSRVDLGAIHQRAAQAVDDNPDLQARQLAGIDAGAIDGSPWTGVTWLYRVTTDEGPSVGMVKQRAATKEGRSVFCQHDEVGYGASFARVFETLVRELRWGGEPSPTPAFRELSVAALEGRPVGVQEIEVFAEPAGATRTEIRGAFMLPVAGDLLAVHDSLRRQQGTGTGELVSELRIQTRNGEAQLELLLDRDASGSWQVRGRFGDRAVEAAAAAPGAVTSLPGRRHALAALVAADEEGGSMTQVEWIPSADPAALLSVETRLVGDVDDGSFLAMSRIAGQESSSSQMLLDPKGQPIGARFPVGGVQVELLTVYQQGALP